MSQAKCISIADCRLCKNIPQKSVEDLESPVEDPEEGQKIPKEAQEFTTITTIESEPHRYAISVDKLLKCPLCGTYYYYNHYDDDGEFFMDGTSDDIEVRRYDPLSALKYLESIAGVTTENVPKPLGQLKKEFLSGVPFEETVTDEALSKQAKAAAAELEELRERYPKIMEDLANAIRGKLPNWHLIKYCVESLCNHFLVEGKFKEIHELLLQHLDPVVRLESAGYILGIGTGDASVIELIHKTGSVQGGAKKFVSENMDVLTHVFYDAAISDAVQTRDYDWLMGWFKTTTRIKALYNLGVAASYKADIAFTMPGLARTLTPGLRTNINVCNVFKHFVDQRKKGHKKIIIDAIYERAKQVPEILSDPAVLEIIPKRVETPKKKKPTKMVRGEKVRRTTRRAGPPSRAR